MKKLFVFFMLTVLLTCLAACTQQPQHIHEYGEWEITKNPTNTDDGEKVRYCSCGDKQTQVIPAIDETDTCKHIWNTVTTAPTCASNGYDIMTCQLCNKSVKVNETAKLAHTYSDSYSFDNDKHWFACTVCGDAKDKALHTPGADDCCQICAVPLSATPGIVYDVSKDGTYAEVIGYTGTATKVKIAETYKGLPVKVIYENAFKNNDNITSVIIPNSVTAIGEYAFFNCDSLSAIVIPDSVTSIGNYAFQSCSKLNSVVIGNDMTSIGRYAFSDCHSSLYTEYEFGKYVRSGDNPYALLIDITNKNMSSYTIHENTKLIANCAFCNCSRLTAITIPDSVKSIGDSAFYNLDSLSSVVIPDSVTSIGDSAFNDCDSLSSVAIGNSVTTIGNYAFWACDSLSSVVIGNSVTTIGEWVFSSCNSLSSVVIPDSVTTIGNYAFSGCDGLSDVYYTGSEAAWAKINIGDNNYSLDNAKKHFNYKPAEA